MQCDTLLTPTRTTLVTGPLIDPVVEAHGFGPASGYVEFCWLPILGPTATWLYRRLAIPLLVEDEITVDLLDLAISLGLGTGLGRQAPLIRSLLRLEMFGAATAVGERYLVRRALAPLTAVQVRRLSASSRTQHDRLIMRP